MVHEEHDDDNDVITEIKQPRTSRSISRDSSVLRVHTCDGNYKQHHCCANNKGKLLLRHHSQDLMEKSHLQGQLELI